MTKKELAVLVSEKTEVPEKAAGDIISVVLEGISSALERGDSVSLPGFGGFKIAERSAREGRNPRTGEKLQIAASKAVRFTSGRALKERIQ